MAISLRTALSCTPLLCLLVLALAFPQDAAAEDPPKAAPLDKQSQAACSALGHLLGSQRPEGVLAGMAVVVADAAQPAAPVQEAFMLEDRLRGPIVVAQIVGMHDGPTAAAMLQRGLQLALWAEDRPIKDPRIDKDLIVGVEDRKKILGPDENRYEYAAYCNLIVHAREVSKDSLAKVARTDVFYTNLWTDPSRYRGEPIHITGRLGRLVKWEAPRRIWGDSVKTMYEGWIFPYENDGDNPYCVLFTDLPSGVELGEKLNYFIACDAYFFKIYRYESKGKNDAGRPARRDAPLLIGRTFALATPPAKDEPKPSPFEGFILVPTLIVFIGGLFALFLGIHWWFRRGDRAVQSRLRDARNTGFVEPGVNESPRAEPPVSVEEQRSQNGTSAE